jgi:dTMP kinase
VVVAFLLFGQFVVNAFDVVLLLLTVDFVTIALATDRVVAPPYPSDWRMGPLARTGVVVGVLALGESLGLLEGLRRFRPGLVATAGPLHTFGFEILFYFGIFTILSVRSHGPFWSRRPGRELLAAISVDLLGITAAVTVGFPYLTAVPLADTLLLLGAVALATLGVNDAVKTWLLRPRPGDRPPPSARAEALLMAADRAEHVEAVIRPALEAGRWVVTDRFAGSTLAYQGWGRGLADGPLRQVVAWAAGGVEADLSIFVDVPPAVARERLAGLRPDRLERLDPAFHERVRHGYVALARAEPARWARVDGTPTADEVAEAVAAVVSGRLGLP